MINDPAVQDLVYTLRQELAEAQSEIRRHHGDFEKIRDLIEPTLQWGVMSAGYKRVLREIRGIVG